MNFYDHGQKQLVVKAKNQFKHIITMSGRQGGKLKPLKQKKKQVADVKR